MAHYSAAQVDDALRELRVIGIELKTEGDFVFVKADGMPPALNASSLGTADSNIFNSEKIRQRVVMAVEREGLGESSIASLELEIEAEARDIFNRAREDLEIRGDRFLAAMRLKEADDVIKGILTGAFKADLLEALGPWAESALIADGELDSMVSRIQQFVFGEAMQTANAAISILQKYYDNQKIVKYQTAVDNAVKKVASAAGKSKLSLATNFTREGMAPVRDAMLPFAKRVKELKIYYDGREIPGRKDMSAWSGLDFNVILTRFANGS